MLEQIIPSLTYTLIRYLKKSFNLFIYIFIIFRYSDGFAYSLDVLKSGKRLIESV